jgi:putative DNA primase/helicase
MKKPKSKRIPAQLKALRQWAGWRLKRRKGGKMGKIPVSPETGVLAKVNAPRLWGSFAAALQACKSGKWGCAGIGFVFTRQDPYVGIDLDHCRDSRTGAIDPWAQEIIDKAKSYTEISPSGTGFHIWVKVKEKPLSLVNRKFRGIEIFVSSVYLTVTGDHLPGTPKCIAYGDKFVEKLIAAHSKKESKVRTSGKSPGKPKSQPNIKRQDVGGVMPDKFQRLYSGDWSGYSSQSEADLALCSILASLTGSNRSLMDQLFRNSGLFREKWTQKHFSSGKTYGEATIAKAIDTCYSPPIRKRTGKRNGHQTETQKNS